MNVFIMNDKTGRNEPCPCGSGKKYKHCCRGMRENALQLQSVRDETPNFSQYREIAEKWERSRNAAPGRGKSKRRQEPDAATVHDLNDIIGDPEFRPGENWRDFTVSRLDAMERVSEKHFLGLTRPLVRSIIHKPFEDNSGIVVLNETIAIGPAAPIPAISCCLFLLRKISDHEKGIKAKRNGELPHSLVQDFYSQFHKENYIIQSSPVSESETTMLRKTRFFLKDAGYIKLQGGRFSVTLQGRKSLYTDDHHAMYLALFQYMTSSYNWLYGNRYPEVIELMQRSLIFCLFILKKKATKPILGDKLATYYKKAFPSLVNETGSKDGEAIVRMGFSHLFCDEFAWQLGLLDKTGGENTFLSGEFQYMTTDLFDKLFLWKV